MFEIGPPFSPICQGLEEVFVQTGRLLQGAAAVLVGRFGGNRWPGHSVAVGGGELHPAGGGDFGLGDVQSLGPRDACDLVSRWGRDRLSHRLKTVLKWLMAESVI